MRHSTGTQSFVLTFKRNMEKLDPQDIEGSFLGVAGELFNDGSYSWSRIVMIMTFGYKLFKKVSNITVLIIKIA